MNEAQTLVSSEGPLVESEDTLDFETTQKIARIYAEMQTALNAAGYVDFDLTRDGRQL